MGVIYIDLKFKIVQVLIKGTRISDCMNISFPDNTGVGSAVFCLFRQWLFRRLCE